MTRHADPPIQSDRHCYVCPLPLPAQSLKHGDPFCSTDCAKVYHATVARRLELFPRAHVLIERNSELAETTLTRRELLWVIERAIPQMDAGRRRNTTRKDVELEEDVA